MPLHSGQDSVPAELTDLSNRIAGVVALPGTSAYAAAREVFAPAGRVRRPTAVVRPAGAKDVARTLTWAGETGTRIAVRSGGHSFDGFSVPDDRILLDLSGLSEVTIDPDGRLHAMPGARISAVANALNGAGRALPHGDCPTVGLGGLVTGGGFGYATRRFGLTLDFLDEATIVTPDGAVHAVDRNRAEDLFWACRGGAGAAGITTEFVLETVEIGLVTGMTLAWRWDAAAEALLLFDDLLRTAPEELDLKLKIRTTGPGRFMDMASSGPEDAIPGRPLVHIDGQFLGRRQDATDLLKPLLAHEAVREAVVREESYYDAMLQLVPLGLLNDPAPATLRPIRVASDFVRGRLDPEHATALVRFVEELQKGPGFDGGAVLIEPASGAVASTASDATAFAHRHADLLIQWELFGPLMPDAKTLAQQDRLLSDARRALAPVLTGGRYVNYADRLDEPEQWWGDNLPRLSRLADTYDPNRVLISRLHP